jgi:hypothetical protein
MHETPIQIGQYQNNQKRGRGVLGEVLNFQPYTFDWPLTTEEVRDDAY